MKIMKTQYGRSMIEMLGVLAIIGVLSIGGLAGYTRAMRAHRANNILGFVNRCYIEQRSKGNGLTAEGPDNCALTDTPAGLSGSVSCQRIAGGATVCNFTVDASLDTVIAAKIGSETDASHKYHYRGTVWGAGTNTAG